MDHFRLRKYRGPETWKRVREAYLAGEPGPSVAQRFDVSLANLRKKASVEGWTRNAMARRFDLKLTRDTPDPPPPAIAPLDPRPPGVVAEPSVDPRTAQTTAIKRAADLLAADQPEAAMAHLKAAEALGRAMATHPFPSSFESDEQVRAELRRKIMALCKAAEAKKEEEAKAEREMQAGPAMDAGSPIHDERARSDEPRDWR